MFRNFNIRQISKIKKEIINENKIFTLIGITLDPKNGLEIKNADNLIEHKRNLNKYSKTELSSRPGKASIGL